LFIKNGPEWVTADAARRRVATADIDMIRTAETTAYDADADPRGEVFWRKLAANVAQQEPFALKASPQLDLDGVATFS
jgi:hypothetical protein